MLKGEVGALPICPGRGCVDMYSSKGTRSLECKVQLGQTHCHGHLSKIWDLMCWLQLLEGH
jgi:hypothetical protein